ncbi:hypothetical protein [Actimicrobium antarcticum]|uniref:Lipoprotein n=1 Tax=Actimicrobium antarcticum TaxID=1051899 RepID=A0ABP7SVW6_9BURK
MRIFSVFCIGLLVAGCATKPPVPGWKANAHGALDSFSAAYLTGNTRIADQEFSRARLEISSTGKGDLLARAELVRCANRVASLEFDQCAGYQPLAGDAGAIERSYAALLTGRWQDVDASVLPAQYRAVLAGAASSSSASVIGSIDDPLSRLVAAGVLLQAGAINPADITAATETASEQGWRRPLLAWLGVQAQRARDGGDLAALARIERRIGLTSAPLK